MAHGTEEAHRQRPCEQQWFWEKFHDACAERAIANDWKLPNNIHSQLIKNRPELFTAARQQQRDTQKVLQQSFATEEGVRKSRRQAVGEPRPLVAQPPLSRAANPPVPREAQPMALAAARSASDLLCASALVASPPRSPSQLLPLQRRRASPAKAEQLFRSLDKNGDGTLSLQEFADGMALGAVQNGLSRRPSVEQTRLAPLALKPSFAGTFPGKGFSDEMSEYSTRDGSAVTSARSSASGMSRLPSKERPSGTHDLQVLVART